MHKKIRLFSTLCGNPGFYLVNKSRLHSKLEKNSQQQCSPLSPQLTTEPVSNSCWNTAPWHRGVSVWRPGWECSQKEHLLDGYLEMGLCPLNSTELLSGCCSRWSTAKNPDCSSGCPAAALLSERAPAPRRPPSPHPAGYTQERDSVPCLDGLANLHRLLAVSPPKQSLSPSQPNRTVANHLLELRNRSFFGCHCSTNANTQGHILSCPRDFHWPHQHHTSTACRINTCQHKAHQKVLAGASTSISFAPNSLFEIRASPLWQPTPSCSEVSGPRQGARVARSELLHWDLVHAFLCDVAMCSPLVDRMGLVWPSPKEMCLLVTTFISNCALITRKTMQKGNFNATDYVSN